MNTLIVISKLNNSTYKKRAKSVSMNYINIYYRRRDICKAFDKLRTDIATN